MSLIHIRSIKGNQVISRAIQIVFLGKQITMTRGEILRALIFENKYLSLTEKKIRNKIILIIYILRCLKRLQCDTSMAHFYSMPVCNCF